MAYYSVIVSKLSNLSQTQLSPCRFNISQLTSVNTSILINSFESQCLIVYWFFLTQYLCEQFISMFHQYKRQISLSIFQKEFFGLFVWCSLRIWNSYKFNQQLLLLHLNHIRETIADLIRLQMYNAYSSKCCDLNTVLILVAIFFNA